MHSTSISKPHQLKRIVQRGFISAIFLALFSNASATPVGISLGVSTLGPGISLSYDMSEKFNGRFGINKYSQGFDLVVEENNYEGDVNLHSMTALLDWHPWSGGFRISGGLVSNSNSINGTAVSTNDDTIEFAGKEYSLQEAGTVNADIEFDPTSLFLGMGWGNAAKGGGFSFFTDIGVVFHGEPDADITVENATEIDLPQEDLDKAVQDFENEISQLRYFPVFTLGFAYNL